MQPSLPPAFCPYLSSVTAVSSASFTKGSRTQRKPLYYNISYSFLQKGIQKKSISWISSKEFPEEILFASAELFFIPSPHRLPYP